MSSNQSAKYKKFIIGAASAALVASAVAPVVASAKDFSDTKGNTHEPAINALSDSGVITGYPNGSFLPNKTLTRSDVVKLMGKWLVSEGRAIPTDYKTNMRFKDLTSTSNDELLQYAAVVKDNGVFNGSDSRLLAGDNITRENMAVVLVRAFDQVKGFDLVTFVAGQDFKKDVTDLTKAKAEARPAIDVLDFFDITNPAAPAFNPKNTTTRGQFATFLHKTINTDFSAVKVVDGDLVAAAAQVKSGAVTVSRGEYATDANKLAAVQAHVKEIITNKEVVATVVAGKTAGDYVVTLTKGEEKVEKTIAVTFEFAADDRFVTEVKSINAVQLEVKFSTAVDSASIFNANGTLKTGVITLTSLDAVNAGTLTAELSENGKTLTITTQDVVSKRYDVVIDGLKSVTGDAIAKYSEMITIAADTTAPTITGTEQISANKVKIKFSEPVKAHSTATLKYEDGTVVAQTSVNVPEKATEVIVDLSDSAVEVNKSITVTFIGLKDMAGNLATPNPATVQITKQQVDGVKPSVTSVSQTGVKTFNIKFSKDVVLLATAGVINVSNVEVSNYIISSIKKVSGNEYKVTVEENLDGVQNVTVKSGYKDLSNQVGDAVTKVVTFTADTVAAKAINTKVIVGSDNSEYLEITYDKDVTEGNLTISGSYEKNHVTTQLSSADKTASYASTSDKKVLRVALAGFATEKGAIYKITAVSASTAGVVSLSGVAPEKASASFTRGEDGSQANTNKLAAPAIVKADNDTLTVTFTGSVDGASATDLANYKVDGAVVESATLAAANAGTQVVTLKLKANSNAFTGVRNITVENVKALGSTVTMDKFVKNDLSLTENVAPTVTSAKLTGNKEITITFSEAVVSGDENDFELLVGGKSLATPVKGNAVVASTGLTATFTLSNTVTADQLSQGLSLKVLSDNDITDTPSLNKLSSDVNPIAVTQ